MDKKKKVVKTLGLLVGLFLLSAVLDVGYSEIVPFEEHACLTVTPDKVVIGIIDLTLDVTITGHDTNWNNDTEVSFSCPGITINSTNTISEIEIVANITISADADACVSEVETETNDVHCHSHGAFEIVKEELCLAETIYSEHAAKTELLRNFRDNVLSHTQEGQELIRLYYQWSPVIVKAMEEDEGFKGQVKEMIDGVLEMMGREAE